MVIHMAHSTNLVIVVTTQIAHQSIHKVEQADPG
jgi:hypothetical protein